MTRWNFDPVDISDMSEQASFKRNVDLPVIQIRGLRKFRATCKHIEIAQNYACVTHRCYSAKPQGEEWLHMRLTDLAPKNVEVVGCR
jgi:hypothetical protein